MKSKVNTWVLRLIAFTIFSLCSANTMADKFVIGAQRLDYFPHYDFTSSRDRGVAWAILEAFSKYSGHELVYLSLPVKRLQIELQKEDRSKRRIVFDIVLRITVITDHKKMACILLLRKLQRQWDMNMKLIF